MGLCVVGVDLEHVAVLDDRLPVLLLLPVLVGSLHELGQLLFLTLAAEDERQQQPGEHEGEGGSGRTHFRKPLVDLSLNSRWSLARSLSRSFSWVLSWPGTALPGERAGRAGARIGGV